MSFTLQLVFTALLAAASVCTADDDDGGQHWALLVAGSNTYSNYRHQADICHAYHIISKNGIPDERIIVMMYDDIAHSPDNPYPGNIINEPNGTNVYPGVLKDYTKEEVTPDIFIKVLTGDAEGVEATLGRPGKVIKSGPNDRIFVNFADHGGPGILAFPSDLLHVVDFHDAIRKMHKKKMYKQLVFYVEACESGSMFYNFTKPMSEMNVYATTAANRSESSFACYFDDDRGTFLGDYYSVNWMQDSDQENLKRETLEEQFKLVKKETLKSHVMEFGNMDISKLPVGDFQGTLDSSPLRFVPRRTAPNPGLDAVPSEDVPIEILYRKIAKAEGVEREQLKDKLHKLLQRKDATEDFFKKVSSTFFDKAWYEHFLYKPVEFTDYRCYRESLSLIMNLCPAMNLTQNDFALRKLRVLANICEENVAPETMWRAISKVISEADICIN
ncbi:legumain [Plakobranchus ocellatus]|uniref:Hemoglobinase n=1 Tax=Plakobranchus ocellatus TaxID=259542 RepID=A0AAV3ZUY2_9GAST|nr:legumain [Plakobranchus ocellatus]